MATQQEILIQEIEGLNSSQFERLCYILVDALSGRSLIHKGIDSRGRPRRSTVDSYSDDGTIVGEYSVDRNYFSNLSKPEGDIDHALREHPQVQKIYLLAGVQIRPSEGKGMAALCSKMQKRFQGKQGKIIWYDAERIARYILKDLLTQTELVRKISEFLPTLNSIYLSSPDTAVFPKLPQNYQVNPVAVEKAYQMLSTSQVLLLTGISGVGKSTFAVKLATKLLESEQLDTAYFIDSARQIESCRDLSAADCELGGQKINLIGTLQTRKSLVILDDLRHDLDQILEQLTQDVGSLSYVVVTSQISSDYAKQAGIEFQVPFLNDEVLIGNVVNWKLPKEKRCTPEEIHLIARKTKGYPLILDCIRTSIRYGRLDHEDLEDFLEDIAGTEVDGEKKLMTRLLSRHLDAVEYGILSIRWLNSQYISEPLLEKIATKADVHSLRKRSFIQSTTGIIKIHDIIYQCMRELVMREITQPENERYQKRFYLFFQKERDSKSANYFKALHIHEEKIAELARTSQKPGVEWYFYLQSQSGDSSDSILGFTDEQLETWLGNTHDKYVVGTVLEYIDYRLRYIDYQNPARGDYIKASINMLRNVLPQLKPWEDIYLSAVHHIGKLLVSARDQVNAMCCFQHILESEPDRYETRLQVARIHKRTKQFPMAILEYRKLLDAYLNGQNISMSVVLAAYEDISSMKMEKEDQQHYLLDQFLMLQKAISSMAVESFDQPYKVLAKTIKFYTYDYPEKVIQLIQSVPIPSIETIRKDSCFDVAQMYKEMGKAIMWAKEGELSGQKQDQFYFSIAEEFYCSMPLKALENEFQNTQRAENLLLLGRYQEAKEVLRGLDKSRACISSFWHYRMGQVYAHGDANSLRRAEELFQHAIDLEKADSKYLAAFFHEKAKVQIQLGDPGAKETLEQALAHCEQDKEKFRKQVQEELEQYLQSSS